LTENRDPRLIEAEAAKFLAEAEKFKAETAVFLIDQEIKKAEAKQKAAHARSAEYGAESMRVQTEATLRQEKMALAADHHHHEFAFSASVYDEAVEKCLYQLSTWHRQDAECPMHIIIDSPGGSVIDGMHLFDQIMAYSKRPWDTSSKPKGTHDTTITVRGYAASMAGILLQSADKRVIGPESYLMIHQVSSFAQGKIGELKDEVKFLDKMSDRVVDVFVTRANGGIDKETFVRNWDRQDWWLTSEEALEYGFVDEIG
jgi:ATP-dependent Clp endopeptidase proteolytic subunit ClpP